MVKKASSPGAFSGSKGSCCTRFVLLIKLVKFGVLFIAFTCCLDCFADAVQAYIEEKYILENSLE